MNIQKIENRLLYCPNQKNLEINKLSTFNGEAHFTQKILNVIGEEGINHISKKLESLIQMKAEICGNHSKKLYGLDAHQRFFDLKERITIDVKAIVNQYNVHQYDKSTYDHFYSEDFQDDFTITINEEEDEVYRVLCSRGFKKSNIRAYNYIKSGQIGPKDHK